MPTTAGLYYFSHGEEAQDKVPVILIHGAGGTHLHWPPQVRRLNGQRVYAPDLPGHGKSEGIGRQSVSAYSDVLLEFTDALSMQSVILVGLSMGSAIALDFALRYPERTLGLGLLGSGAKMRVNPALLESAANSANFPAVVQLVIDNSYSPGTDERVKELAAKQLSEVRPAVLHGDFVACDAFDVMEQVDQIQIPTVLICGSADRMTPLKYSEYLCEQISGAQLHAIEGAGHMVTIERPEEVASLLDDFIRSIQS